MRNYIRFEGVLFIESLKSIESVAPSLSFAFMTVENEIVYTPVLLTVIESSLYIRVTPLEGPSVSKITLLLLTAE